MSTAVLEELPQVVPPPPRRLVRTMVFFAAIFGAGGLTGAGVATWYWQVNVPAQSGPPIRSGFFDGFVDHMKNDYELSDEQVAKLKAVVQQNRERIDLINRDFQPKFKHSIDQLNSEIAALLNSEQRVKWEKKTEELRAKWASRRNDHRREPYRRDSHSPRGANDKKLDTKRPESQSEGAPAKQELLNERA